MSGSGFIRKITPTGESTSMSYPYEGIYVSKQAITVDPRSDTLYATDASKNQIFKLSLRDATYFVGKPNESEIPFIFSLD